MFAAACCRRVWPLLTDARSRHAVETAELFAEGLVNREQLAVACETAHARGLECNYGIPWAVAGCTTALSEKELDAGYVASGIAGVRGMDTNAETGFDDAKFEAERAEQSKLLCCIFGNPWASPTISQAWLSDEVVALAREAYEERKLPEGTLDPMKLLPLADALEVAGCADQAVVGHLREPIHVRGCHVVDCIVGKS